MRLKKLMQRRTVDPAFLERFEAEEAISRVPNYRIASGLGAIFIAAGSVMDRLAFPEIWHTLVLLRGECAFTLLLLYCLLGTKWGERRHLIIGHFIEGSLILSIMAMVGRTGGASSPYYAGLCLVMVGASLLLRWSIMHGVVNVVFCCGGYSLLIVLFPVNNAMESGSHLAVHTFFLYVTGFFTAAGTYFLYELRLNEFRLREELTAERKRLEKSHQKLKELDESKTNFFANVSHELRTPLTLILGPIEQLASYAPVRDNPKLNTLVQSMEENGFRLLRLINELLDIIRLDGGQYGVRTELTQIDDLMGSIYRSLVPTAEQKGLNLELHLESAPKGTFQIDRMKFEKVLINLATNAIKFTQPGGTVKLIARETTGREVEFEISDTGAGMSDEEKENVFRRFWQADASSKRRHRGAGIGLSLVKGLVDLLEGTIQVSSEMDEGTTFTVKLPLGPSTQTSSIALDDDDLDPIEELNRKAQFGGLIVEANAMPVVDPLFFDAPDNKTPVILVAEDEPDVRQLIVSQLSSYKLLIATNGNQAIELATQYLPDLLLLDWMMPEKDGLEVCQILRKTTALERAPIIMLTARIDERSKIEALQAGANDFLTKPFAPTELKLRISHLLNTGRFEKEVVQKSQELGAALAELKESESMLVQAEKLSSLGQMSAGIIHEINNPLNYAKTNLYSLRTFAKLLPPDEKEDFNEITSDVEEGLERVVQIVKDLRSFAVKDKTQFNDVNLAEVVAASSRLLGNRLSHVQFKSEVPDHIHINGNSNQLCQVLVNFIQNSLDALQEAERENEQGMIQVEVTQSSEWISLHLKDNGCGISLENQQQIFDPFYSSKDIGQGMGLGLSICYRILDQHGVKIELKSDVGVGTHFTLNFPIILDDREFQESLTQPPTEEPNTINHE
ncbi:ATP-binding protein [Roseibacillus persicicus]|uniref:ATP-binding protein n=1 Tax=Roseibacillus persicicus TaxID=454148 RepID=UPI00280F561C|nr:ATP-binding protein [Roseibacillus persicicus]MDQ8192000.1 ATP-binding protein [Roseibacillus persicicus]